MNKKYSESAINKGTEIEMEHAETIKKYLRDGVSVKEVARAIAIDHLEESPTYYEDLKEEYAKGGGVNEENIQPRDLSEINNFEKIYKGAEYYSFSDNVEKQQKSDRWYELFVKNQKEKQLNKNEFIEFIDLSNELYFEDLEDSEDSEDFKNGGIIKKENLARIYCHNPKCNWNWSVESGGDDLYVCHKCNTDNEKFYVKGGSLKNDFEIEENEDGDRIIISLKGIGEVILVQTSPEYEFIEDIDEDTLEELNISEEDFIGKIEHLEVNDNHKGKGYAKLLMNKAIEIAEEYDWMPLYLNASPMGSKRYGLGVEDLKGFYESLGFKVFLNQGGNNLMMLNKTTFDSNNSDIRFSDGGDTSKNADDKLVALHNISAGQIISANKLGGLVTPSIAILKAGQKFTDFGSITLIPNKELINPKNYDVKVFAGDVYSPTVPRRLFYVDKKKYENVTLKIINKSFNYDKNHEVYNIVSNILSDYNDFFKDLGKMSFDELNKYYYDKMKVVYIVDKDIPIKIPMKESKHFLWNNVDFTLTEEQKKRFAPILREYTQQSNEFGSAGVSKDVLSNVYDLFLEVLDGVKLDLKQQYKGKGEQGDLLYEILIKNLEESFEKYVGTRYSWFGHSEYKLSQAVFGKQELDEKKLDDNIKKIFTKPVIIDYKQWLSDFISQFRGSAYFLKGNEKMPYTLDNLVDATSNRVVGQEKNITFGVNQAKSFSTKQLKSFEEIKKNSKNLISKEEMNIIDESNKNDFFKLSEYLDYEYSNTWGKLDSLGKALADYFKGSSVESSLRKNDFKSPNSFQKETFITFAKKLKDSPVDYFEAKFQRAVKLDEFEYAIVPYDTEKEALEVLKNNGLKIKKYKTDEERVELTNSVVFKDKKLTFKDGGNVLEDKTIYVNSNHGKIPVVLEKHWQDDTELVPVYELKRFREFNRYERPKYNLKDSSENISKLEKEILENGINEPLIIEYSLSDNSVLLIEGNHRLNVAENLGIDYFPARVVLRRSQFPSHKYNNSLKVKGFKPDEYGYVPSNLKPSQVGIFETKKAFEQGGVVEGQLHSECNAETGCGEKYDVGGIGHIIEVERDEAVIVSKAFQDENNYEIKGTPSEIASAINVIGGGMNFDSGAEIKTEDGEKIKVQEIKKEAVDTDVKTIEPNSVIINRRSMYDENEYIAKGTPKQIASQINNLNDNGVKITDGGSIKKA